MKKLNFSVALAALAAVMTTPVVAADPEIVAAADWTGFHIGVGGGGNFVFDDGAFELDFTEFEDDDDDDSIDFDSFSDLGKAGVFGTAEIGADYQMDRMVIGVLANYDFGKTKIKQDTFLETVEDGETTSAEIETRVEVGDSWAAGARIGFLPTDSTLIYALGGFAQAKISQDFDVDIEDGDFNFDQSNSKWKSGYFVGAGVETMLTESISLKGEYRFADFGKVNNDFSSSDIDFNADIEHSSDITVHSVRAVLSFRF